MVTVGTSRDLDSGCGFAGSPAARVACSVLKDSQKRDFYPEFEKLVPDQHLAAACAGPVLANSAVAWLQK